MSKMMKFNPGFQTDEEAIANFVVRRGELDRIVGAFLALNPDDERDSGGAHPFVLIVAPRGAGKTTLCRRVLAETRGEGALSSQWQAIFLGEESYTVTTPGEFFLECLFHLKDQEKSNEVARAYDNAHASRSESELLSNSLSALRQHAAGVGKRLLIIVENFHMIGEQIGSGFESLLSALNDESTFGVLATSVAQAKEDDSASLLDQYLNITLSPLDLPECHSLWAALSDQDVKLERIRPLQILTGGSPRLLHILAEFMKTPSLQDLMDNLNLLIDQNTEYFKSQLDALPPVERKVFAALLDLWDPSSAKQISESARVNTNIASAMLARLSERGSVIKVPGKGRQAIYYAAERLFNIYYLMRRRSHPSNRVRALVSFMTEYYDRDELVSTTALLVREACTIDPGRRDDYHSAFDAIMAHAPEGVRRRILEQTPQEFIQPFRDAQKAQRGLSGSLVADGSIAQNPEVIRMMEEFEEVADSGDFGAAEELLEKVIELQPDMAEPWIRLALLQYRQKKTESAIVAARRASDLKADDPWTHAILGMLLARSNDQVEAEAALRASVALDPRQIMAVTELADLYGEQGDTDRAIDLFAQGRAAGPLPDVLLGQYGHLLIDNERGAEAEEILAVDAMMDAENIHSRRVLADYLYGEDREDEAVALLRSAADTYATWESWADLGIFIHARLDEPLEARRALEQAISLGADEFFLFKALAAAISESAAPRSEVLEVASNLLQKFPDEAGAWTAAGQIYREIEDDLAEPTLRTAIERGSNAARLELAKLITVRGGEAAEVEALLQEAFAKSGRNCRPAKEFAEFLVHKGDDTAASEVLKEKLEQRADCLCSLVLQGQICTRQRDLEGAKNSFEAALELKDDAIAALTGLAAVVDKARAEALISKAVEEAPEDARPLLARAQLRMGSPKNQIADGEAALEIRPSYTEARLLLAPLHAEQGQLDSAMTHLEVALTELGGKRELISSFVAAAMIVARHGTSAQVSALLARHDEGAMLEPLSVALQLSRGEEPLVAKEVLEVAKDIVARFPGQ